MLSGRPLGFLDFVVAALVVLGGIAALFLFPPSIPIFGLIIVSYVLYRGIHSIVTSRKQSIEKKRRI
jgi:hypothetical protein